MLSSQTKDPITAAALERMREVLAGVLFLLCAMTAIERTWRASCGAAITTAAGYIFLTFGACPDSSHTRIGIVYHLSFVIAITVSLVASIRQVMHLSLNTAVCLQMI